MLLLLLLFLIFSPSSSPTCSPSSFFFFLSLFLALLLLLCSLYFSFSPFPFSFFWTSSVSSCSLLLRSRILIIALSLSLFLTSSVRLWVVIRSVDPLRVYVHKDGLALFTTVKYTTEGGALSERTAQLTNNAVNKNNKVNEQRVSCRRAIQREGGKGGTERKGEEKEREAQRLRESERKEARGKQRGNTLITLLLADRYGIWQLWRRKWKSNS